MSKERNLIPAWRDTVVHYIFGSLGHEDVLLSLLNSVLLNDNQPLARSVEMRNPFNPQTFLADKFTILDVKATDESGKVFAIEFQATERKAFIGRMVFNCAKPFCAQIKRGDNYTDIHPVIGIAFVIYDVFPQLAGVHHSFCFRSKANPEFVLTDLLQLHFLEITDAKAGEFDRVDPSLRRWLYFFYLSHRKTEAEMSVLLEGDPQVEKAYQMYRRFNHDERMRALADAHELFILDYNSDVLEARQTGLAEGVAMGELRGQVNAIITLLQGRFHRVPDEILDELNQRKDLIALQSLVVCAATCESLADFQDALK